MLELLDKAMERAGGLVARQAFRADQTAIAASTSEFNCIM
jgi:hypothetical protein